MLAVAVHLSYLASVGGIGAESPDGALRLSGGSGERGPGPLRVVDVELLDPSLPVKC